MIGSESFQESQESINSSNDNSSNSNNSNSNSINIKNGENGSTNTNGSDTRYAVVLNRPPGHHCNGREYSGYCFINNTAVAIEKCLTSDTKIFILDIDIHHGNGTQSIFYGEKNVLHVSLHEFDGYFFPCTGDRNEFGPSSRHEAFGTNINVTLTPGCDNWDVLYSLKYCIWPIVEQFKPDIAFYSVGTDGITNDKSNADTFYSAKLYGTIAKQLKKYVNKIVVTTEGGYSTHLLANGMKSVLQGLSEQEQDSQVSEKSKSECGDNGDESKDDEFGFESIELKNVLWDTVETVKYIRTSLRRVWKFESNDDEMVDKCTQKQCRKNSYYQLHPERKNTIKSSFSIGHFDVSAFGQSTNFFIDSDNDDEQDDQQEDQDDVDDKSDNNNGKDSNKSKNKTKGK